MTLDQLRARSAGVDEHGFQTRCLDCFICFDLLGVACAKHVVGDVERTERARLFAAAPPEVQVYR